MAWLDLSVVTIKVLVVGEEKEAEYSPVDTRLVSAAQRMRAECTLSQRTKSTKRFPAGNQLAKEVVQFRGSQAGQIRY